jgi:hypothetical protein
MGCNRILYEIGDLVRGMLVEKYNEEHFSRLIYKPFCFGVGCKEVSSCNGRSCSEPFAASVM